MPLSVRELSTSEYHLWDNLATVSPQRSIFTQRWWMELVTFGGVRLLGCFQGDSLLAGLPIWPCRTLGVERLRQPLLTPYWGPLLRPDAGRYSARLTQEFHVLRALAAALTSWRDVAMQFHPSLQNWLPFYWHGYSQTTRYTYRIERPAEMSADGGDCEKTVRQKLRYAQQHRLVVRDGVPPALVADMHARSLERQGLEAIHEIAASWPLLAAAARAHDCLLTSAAFDPDGQCHSAMALIWDDRFAYGIFGGSDPRSRASSAATLTLWRQVQAAAERNLGYDFEGSMLEPVEGFFRRFGGELCPYFRVAKAASRRLNVARSLRAWGSRGKAQQRRRVFHRGAEPADAVEEHASS